MNMTLITADDGRQVWASPEQAHAIEVLQSTRLGGCASVLGYRPTTNWKVAPVQNIQILTRFSTARLYERRMEALSNITFNDVKDAVARDEKLSKLSEREAIALFEERKAGEVASLNKTLEGDRSDAHRQGHDRCYAHFGDGVKVNLDTEKGADGIKYPVLHEGYPMVKAIMVDYLELNKKTVEEGERKVVNSGNPVRMTNAIKSCLNARSVGFKTLSLKGDNFDSLKIDRQEILAEDVEGILPADLIESAA